MFLSLYLARYVGGMGGWCDKSFQCFWGDSKNSSLTQKIRLGGPFRYLEYCMLVKATEKILEVFEKAFPSKRTGCVRIFLPDFELHFFKIWTFFTFPDITSDWCVVRSRFFYWRKELGSPDLSSTLNMFVKSTEIFLEAFQKKVSAQKMGFVRIFPH